MDFLKGRGKQFEGMMQTSRRKAQRRKKVCDRERRGKGKRIPQGDSSAGQHQCALFDETEMAKGRSP